MYFKSKDMIRITDMGIQVKDSLVIEEYHFLDNLNEPIIVHQLYQILINQYPKDYPNGTVDFNKIMDKLGGQKCIEKIELTPEEDEYMNLNFYNEEFVDMSTVVDENVEFISKEDKKRKKKRRTDRWFNMQKLKPTNGIEELSIEKSKKSKLNYTELVKKYHIGIPIEQEENESKDRYNNTISEESENEGLVKISFNKESKEDIERIKFKEKELNEKRRKDKLRVEREKYNKRIKNEKLKHKKFEKPKIKENSLVLIIQKVINRIIQKFKK